MNAAVERGDVADDVDAVGPGDSPAAATTSPPERGPDHRRAVPHDLVERGRLRQQLRAARGSGVIAARVGIAIDRNAALSAAAP